MHRAQNKHWGQTTDIQDITQKHMELKADKIISSCECKADWNAVAMTHSREEKSKCNSPRVPSQALYAGKTPADFKGRDASKKREERGCPEPTGEGGELIYLWWIHTKCKSFRYKFKRMKKAGGGGSEKQLEDLLA